MLPHPHSTPLLPRVFFAAAASSHPSRFLKKRKENKRGGDARWLTTVGKEGHSLVRPTKQIEKKHLRGGEMNIKNEKRRQKKNYRKLTLEEEAAGRAEEG